MRRVHAPTGLWFTIPATSEVLTLTHVDAMQAGGTPAIVSFAFTAFGAPVVPLVRSWSGSKILAFSFPLGTLSEPSTAQLIVEDPNYKLPTGQLMDLWGPIDCYDPPYAQKKLNEWVAAHPNPTPGPATTITPWIAEAIAEHRRHL